MLHHPPCNTRPLLHVADIADVAPFSVQYKTNCCMLQTLQMLHHSPCNTRPTVACCRRCTCCRCCTILRAILDHSTFIWLRQRWLHYKSSFLCGRGDLTRCVSVTRCVTVTTAVCVWPSQRHIASPLCFAREVTWLGVLAWPIATMCVRLRRRLYCKSAFLCGRVTWLGVLAWPLLCLSDFDSGDSITSCLFFGICFLSVVWCFWCSSVAAVWKKLYWHLFSNQVF